MNIILYAMFIFTLFSSRDSAIAKEKYYNFTITFNDTGVNLRNDVRFFLYKRNDGETPYQLWLDDKPVIEASKYNTNKSTKFMTHGWLNTYLGLNCCTVRKAFLAQDDYNVIVVDWGNIAKLPYLMSAAKIKVVARYIAQMIGFLVNQGTDPEDMTLVGHSLGAHVMGLAGYQSTTKVGHIVGLDPASPGFLKSAPGCGISSADAQVVEIIHTNVDDLGLSHPAGHLDFFPNGGGEKQPGCGIDVNNYCAHDRAFIYYAESLTRPDGFLAVYCDSWEVFIRHQCDLNESIMFPGWSAKEKKGKKGTYFLRTASESPFGLGLQGTKAENKI